MSTTIDSLDIQISTSAGSSAQKIDELAKALSDLRGNAGLTKVTNNLHKLAGALDAVSKTNVNTQNLGKLAGALQRLSGIQNLKGLNSALNTLKKIPTIVGGVDSTNLDGLSGQFTKLSTALDGLKGIEKLQGFNNVVNTLGKLPKVIAGLDATDLDKFTRQIEKLVKALDPLATKIEKIGTGFSQLPSRISSAVTATNRMSNSIRQTGESINSTNLNLFSFMQNADSIIGITQQIIQSLSNVMSQAIEWDGIQYRFGRAFGEDAEEVYAHVQRIHEVMGINIQEFMQYSSLYGSLLKGFGMAQEKVTTISVGLTELSYDIWAAYNDRFKSLEDASEAVRSAITGEIEPIRNAGIALTEASLQEFIDSTHLAGVSIEKLSEAQKAEVRYAAMVNAAMNQGIVGTYAREMHTAEGAVRSLSQSMKTLTQAFGSLFIPVLQKVVPYVTAFVELITDAVRWVAALFGIKLFEIDWSSTSAGIGGVADSAADAASGLGGAADAAKKLKDYTMGFDELNVISPDSGSGGGGGGGGAGGGGAGWGDGLELDTLWDDAVFDAASKQVDEIKNKILGFFDKWKTEIQIISAALGVLGMAKMLSHLGQALGFGEKFLGVMKTIQKLSTTAIVIVLQYSLQTEFFKGFIDGEGFKKYVAALFVGAIGTGILFSMWGTTGLVIGLGVTAAASLSAIIDNGGITNVESAVTALTGLASAFGAIYLTWKKVVPLITGSNLYQVLIGIKNGSTAASSAFTFMYPTLTKIGTAIASAAKAVGVFLGGISAPAWALIAAVIAGIASAAYFLYENWEKVVKAAKKFFKQNIAPKLEKIGEHFQKIKESVKPFVDAFKEAYDGVKSFLTGIDWPKLSWIGTVFETIGGIIFGVVSGVIAGAFNALVGHIENAIQIFSGLAQIVSGVFQFIVALFTGGDIEAAWEKIWNGVKDYFAGIVGLIIDPIVNFVTGVIDWFTTLWDELVGHSIVPDMINAIVDWFLSLPGKIFKPVQDFVDGIIKKFKDMWSTIKSWFNTNVAPKFTLNYWKTKFDTIVQGASQKLTDVKSKISEKWGDVKSWYNTNVKPKFTVEYWKGVFKSIVDAIGSKLDEAWEKVKTFFSATEWKKKVDDAMEAIKKNFKIPTLPKIKLEVTWSTNVGAIKKAVYEALGLPGWPNLKWSTYATGGFPTMGQMFIANEAGAELVGNIGNRTAVVNNDQIVAAVSQGVYSAVRSAMSTDNSGSQNVNVYLDGKQIYASVKRVEDRRGVSLMGNQLGYVY